MASRLALLAAVFGAMFLVASAYKTTVTTTVLEEDDENPYGRPGSRQQQCREQIQRQKQQLVSRCQQVLTGRISMIGMRGIDEARPQQQQLRQCCQQLRQVEDQCRCQAVEQIVEAQQQQGRLQGQRLREAIQTAENLPNMCNLSSERCSISVRGNY